MIHLMDQGPAFCGRDERPYDAINSYIYAESRDLYKNAEAICPACDERYPLWQLARTDLDGTSEDWMVINEVSGGRRNNYGK